jgi:hypothetical protein
MVNRSHTDDQRPRSFHASPAEALEAPPERFLLSGRNVLRAGIAKLARRSWRRHP